MLICACFGCPLLSISLTLPLAFCVAVMLSNALRLSLGVLWSFSVRFDGPLIKCLSHSGAIPPFPFSLSHCGILECGCFLSARPLWGLYAFAIGLMYVSFWSGLFSYRVTKQVFKTLISHFGNFGFCSQDRHFSFFFSLFLFSRFGPKLLSIKPCLVHFQMSLSASGRSPSVHSSPSFQDACGLMLHFACVSFFEMAFPSLCWSSLPFWRFSRHCHFSACFASPRPLWCLPFSCRCQRLFLGGWRFSRFVSILFFVSHLRPFIKFYGRRYSVFVWLGLRAWTGACIANYCFYDSCLALWKY